MCDRPDHLETNETARTHDKVLHKAGLVRPGPTANKQQTHNGQPSDLIARSGGFERRRLFGTLFLPASVRLACSLFGRCRIAATLGGGGGKVTFFVVVMVAPQITSSSLFWLITTVFFRCQKFVQQVAKCWSRTASDAFALHPAWKRCTEMVYTIPRHEFSRPSWSALQLPPFSAARSMNEPTGPFNCGRPYLRSQALGLRVGNQRRGDWNDINFSGPVRGNLASCAFSRIPAKETEA